MLSMDAVCVGSLRRARNRASCTITSSSFRMAACVQPRRTGTVGGGRGPGPAQCVAQGGDRPPSAIVVGGSSGMGKAAAKEVVRHGGRVCIVSRSQEKLARAKTEILAEVGPAKGREWVRTAQLDNTDETAVKAFFEKVRADEYDSIVVSAADRAVHGAFLELDTDQVKGLFESKFWGAYYCAKYGAPKLAEGGSLVFFSGVLNRRPGINCSPLACVNGAVEGLTRSLALELGPRLRVNCFSPGMGFHSFMDTERFDHMDNDRKAAMLENTAQKTRCTDGSWVEDVLHGGRQSLPLQRVGRAQDAGQALYFLMCNRFTTGIVLDCDGGHQIRQYATQATDPFRKEQ